MTGLIFAVVSIAAVLYCGFVARRIYVGSWETQDSSSLAWAMSALAFVILSGIALQPLASTSFGWEAPTWWHFTIWQAPWLLVLGALVAVWIKAPSGEIRTR